MQKHCHSHQPTPTEQAGGHVHTKPTDFVVSQGLLAPCSACALGPRRETQIASVGRRRRRVCTLSLPRSWHVLAGPSFVCSAGHNHLVHHGPCVPVFSCGTTCLRFLAAVAHCVVTQVPRLETCFRCCSCSCMQRSPTCLTDVLREVACNVGGQRNRTFGPHALS